MKLHTEKGDAKGNKIQVAALYTNADLSVEIVTEAAIKHNDFVKKFGISKAPTFETDDFTLFETNAIFRYIARSAEGFYGANAIEGALVDQWIDFAASEIDLPAAAWLLPIKGVIADNNLATNKAKGDIRKLLKVLDDYLLTRTYLVGERVSAADVAVAASLVDLYKLVLDVGFRKQFVNTNRWFSTITNQPNFVKVFGTTELAKKMAVAPAAPKAAPKAEKKKGQAKAQPKKAEKSTEEEKPAAPAKKEKNPLDLLPPTKLVLDEWKRCYSNEDTEPTANKWFWENYDPEGYSIWFCDYKYNDENTKVFMTCNLVAGFIQRLDALRKYGFGTLLIFGAEPGPIPIAGCWMFRGQEIPKEMTECVDSEYYEWRRADLVAEKDLISNFWAWEGPALKAKYPLEVNQGKVFK